MSVTLEALVGNTTYALSGGAPFWFIGMTGIGLPPVQRMHSRGFGQVGSSDRGFDIKERTMRLLLMVSAETNALADSYRDQLATILQPLTNTPIKLRQTREDGAVRQVDCYATGINDFPLTLQERIGPSQRFVVELEAAQPMPYDPTLQLRTFTSVASGAFGFMVPMDVPWVQDASAVVDAVEVIPYAGQWRTSPIITITGPIDDARIENETTGEVIDFNGVTIADGDYYVVTTGYGRQSVVDSSGDRQIAGLTNDSDLSTFHLASAPEASGGNNQIRVTGSNAGANTRVRMEWYNYYLSF